jgi:hypothetical protein
MDESLMRSLNKGSTFISEGNEVHSLSFLYSGSEIDNTGFRFYFSQLPLAHSHTDKQNIGTMNVLTSDTHTHEQRLLNITPAGEWLESPQYVTRYFGSTNWNQRAAIERDLSTSAKLRKGCLSFLS